MQSFSTFLRAAAERFGRIARSLLGQIKPAELHADAWLAAAEIGEKRGREIDFADPTDQELLLNRVYWNAKGQRDWRLASAHSIDNDREGVTPWADRLAAPASDSPLEILLTREATAIADSAIAACYSQYAAYNVALTNFQSDQASLCAHLLITRATLNERMNKALEVVRRQKSLFTGRQSIAGNFIPLQGQRRERIVIEDIKTEQAELQF